MRRRLAVVYLAVATWTVVAPPPAGAAQRFRYVASPVYSSHPKPIDLQRRTTAATTGWIEVTPLSSQLTVTLDDAVAIRSVHLSVAQGDDVQHLCIHDRVPLTIRNLVAGQPVTMIVHDASYKHRCRGGATTGVLLVAR